MLTLDPDKRPSSAECLEHPWIRKFQVCPSQHPEPSTRQCDPSRWHPPPLEPFPFRLSARLQGQPCPTLAPTDSATAASHPPCPTLAAHSASSLHPGEPRGDRGALPRGSRAQAGQLSHTAMPPAEPRLRQWTAARKLAAVVRPPSRRPRRRCGAHASAPRASGMARCRAPRGAAARACRGA